MADVAQLVRAPVCGTGGRGFKPHHSPHEKKHYLVFMDKVFILARFFTSCLVRYQDVCYTVCNTKEFLC